MQRQWLNVKGQIIDMEPTPAPAPKRQRHAMNRRDAVEAVACIVCIAAEFAAGVYSMTHYGFFSGAPFHVTAVVMAALTWGSFKPRTYRP